MGIKGVKSILFSPLFQALIKSSLTTPQEVGVSKDLQYLIKLGAVLVKWRRDRKTFSAETKFYNGTIPETQSTQGLHIITVFLGAEAATTQAGILYPPSKYQSTSLVVRNSKSNDRNSRATTNC